MYLLITRVRDEEKYLPGLFKSMFSQTVKPALWVLVDHDSKDSSAAVINEAIRGKDWIKLVRIKADETYGLLCHARPLKVGFEKAVEYAAELGIPYRYLGVLDADIEPEQLYFEKLVNGMEKFPGVGIIGGRLYIPDGEKEIPEDRGEVVRGGSRLYRKECFEAIGGKMPESAIWDTETDILAELRGWDQMVVHDAAALHKRSTYSRKGFHRGYSRLGRIFYFSHYHPVAVFLTGLKITVKPPFLTGISFLSAYILAWIRREEQTENPEIREYFWNSFARFRNMVKNRVINLFRRHKKTD